MKIAMIAGTMMAMLMTAACGETPCDKLQKVCTACANTTQRTSCQTIVEGYKTTASVPGFAGVSNDGCQAVIDAKTYDADSAVCKAAN